MLQQERTPLERLGLFFMIWMGCFLFFQLVTAGLLLLIYGSEVYELISSSDNIAQENLNLVRFLQIFLSIGIFGFPPIVFMMLSAPGKWSFFRLDSVPSFKLSLLTIIIMVVSVPLIQWALEVNQHMSMPSVFHEVESYLRDLEEKNQQMLQTLLTSTSRTDLVINFLMIAIIPAVVEELLFRGTLQQLIHKALGNIHIAILFTGIFFSFIHFQFYGFLPRMMLGVLFGYLFFWSGSLWVPMLAHFLNNGVQVVLVYLFQTGRISINIDDVQVFPPYITMISTILLMAAVYIFDLSSQRKPTDGKGLG